MILFPTHCEFQELGTRKTIGVYGGLYSKQVACSTFVFAFDQQCRLGYSSLQVLKLLVLELNHVTSLDCESCPVGKHHCMPLS